MTADPEFQNLLAGAKAGVVSNAAGLARYLGGPQTTIATEALAEFLESCTPTSLRRLSATMRTRSPYGFRTWWYLGPQTAAELCAESNNATILWVLLSLHSDGFVRESAVTALSRNRHPLALGALILRCADWVPEIRERAFHTVQARCVNEVEHFVRWAPMIQGHRGEHARVVTAMARVVAATAGDHIVGQWLTDNDLTVRRSAARSLADGNRHPSMFVWRIALQQHDNPTASILCRSWLDRGTPIEYLKESLGSRFSDIRAASLLSFSTTQHPDVPAILHDALCDRSTMPRRAAQQALGQKGEDVTAHYRQALSATRPNPIAILGLSETGDKDDKALIQSLVLHRDAAVRRAAIEGLGRLGLDQDQLRLVTGFLVDPAPPVARAAHRVLRSYSRWLERDVLRHTVINHAGTIGSALAFRLLGQADPWSSLDAAFDVLANGPSQLREPAVDLVTTTFRNWAASSPRSPAIDQLQRIGRHAAAAMSFFDDNFVQVANFTLRPWLPEL